MKLALLFLSTVLLISCYGKEPKSEKNSFHNKTEEVVNCNGMTGRWLYKGNDKSHSYALKIESTNNQYSIAYCFVTGQNGEQIDCPEEKVIAKCNGNTITVNFISDFEDNPIECKLKLVKNVLKLTATSDVGTSFFIQEMEFVRQK